MGMFYCTDFKWLLCDKRKKWTNQLKTDENSKKSKKKTVLRDNGEYI